MGHRCWTHCPHGHEFTPENTLWINRKTGERHRRCKECHREGRKFWQVYKQRPKDTRRKLRCSI